MTCFKEFSHHKLQSYQSKIKNKILLGNTSRAKGKGIVGCGL